MPQTPATYCQYKCNDNSDENVADAVGSNNAVAYDGDGVLSTTNMRVDGKVNYALEFQVENGEYLNCDTLFDDIKTDTTGSICTWVYVDELNTAKLVCSVADTSADEHLFFQIGTDGKVYIGLVDTGGDTEWYLVTSSAVISATTWTHLALVQDGTEPVLYVNGSAANITWSNEDDKTKWLADLANINNMRIACQNYNGSGNSDFLNGRIDDFRYYQNTALTAAEVKALYNSGNGTEDDQVTYTTSRHQTIIIGA